MRDSFPLFVLETQTIVTRVGKVAFVVKYARGFVQKISGLIAIVRLRQNNIVVVAIKTSTE